MVRNIAIVHSYGRSGRNDTSAALGGEVAIRDQTVDP